jgi:hypothetical protein
MTKSDQIRLLAEQGLPRAEIAKRVGVRYQHVYNVLKRSSLLNMNAAAQPQSEVAALVAQSKQTVLSPTLISALVAKGFAHLGEWKLDESNGIRLTGTAPTKPGVYVLDLDGEVVYVGVSERNLRQRLKFYAKPGPRQRTSIRINKLIFEHLKKGHSISVSIVHPERVKWKDLEIPMDTAVEAGLIQSLRPAWNKMGL